jgi:hypothetical protein
VCCSSFSFTDLSCWMLMQCFVPGSYAQHRGSARKRVRNGRDRTEYGLDRFHAGIRWAADLKPKGEQPTPLPFSLFLFPVPNCQFPGLRPSPSRESLPCAL